MINKYRQKFASQLTQILPKLSVEKLETILERIVAMVEKIEANENMNEDNKEKMTSQLISLQELIQEEIESRNSSEEETLDL
jgi:hypothetical protein